MSYNYFFKEPQPMSFNNKIDEWMKEAEERPESAVVIVRLIET